MYIRNSDFRNFISEVKKMKIISKYDIPYFAGYNWEGNKVYIDKDTPKSIIIKGKTLNLHFSLAMHEHIEKHFINKGYTYAGAHEIATKFEKRYVKSQGIRWKDYDHTVGKLMHINWISSLKLVPKDLDMTPMEYSRDVKTLTKIRKLLR